jgi:hypothetical protein
MSGVVAAWMATPGAHAQSYNNDRWSAQYGARWAQEAFAPVDKVVVWRGPLKVATVSTPDLSSLAQYAAGQLGELASAVGLAQSAASFGDANFVICAGPVYRTTNNACDAAYLNSFRANWYERGLTQVLPDPAVVSTKEEPPVLDRCSFFIDKSQTIAAAFISVSSLDSAMDIRHCLLQGLGLNFTKIEPFFHADYSTDENEHGIVGHELSLLKAGYWVDRLGCAGTADRLACFRRYIDKAEAER